MKNTDITTENKSSALEKDPTDVLISDSTREIHSFVVRAGRMSDKQRRDYEELMPKWSIPYDHSLIDTEKAFGNKNPLTVEIGFGMGKATAIIAQNNPDKNYLGLEVHKPGFGALLGKIDELSLTNLRLIRHDAVEVIEHKLADSSVAAFHIFFPDPWPKKKHFKRRLVKRPFTDLLAKKLIPGGYIYFVSDWLPYAEFALEQLSNTEGLKNMYEGFAPHQQWRPETRFEQKGLDANRVISELMFCKS